MRNRKREAWSAGGDVVAVIVLGRKDDRAARTALPDFAPRAIVVAHQNGERSVAVAGEHVWSAADGEGDDAAWATADVGDRKLRRDAFAAFVLNVALRVCAHLQCGKNSVAFGGGDLAALGRACSLSIGFVRRGGLAAGCEREEKRDGDGLSKTHVNASAIVLACQRATVTRRAAVIKTVAPSKMGAGARDPR
jgi:hypothetical protein